jgi:hypothetical protein
VTPAELLDDHVSVDEDFSDVHWVVPANLVIRHSLVFRAVCIFVTTQGKKVNKKRGECSHYLQAFAQDVFERSHERLIGPLLGLLEHLKREVMILEEVAMAVVRKLLVFLFVLLFLFLLLLLRAVSVWLLAGSVGVALEVVEVCGFVVVNCVEQVV